MPITEGSTPAALPGGMAMVSAAPMPPQRPLLARTGAASEIAPPAFPGAAMGGKTPAFHKRKKAFPRGA